MTEVIILLGEHEGREYYRLSIVGENRKKDVAYTRYKNDDYGAVDKFAADVAKKLASVPGPFQSKVRNGGAIIKKTLRTVSDLDATVAERIKNKLSSELEKIAKTGGRNIMLINTGATN